MPVRSPVEQAVELFKLYWRLILATAAPLALIGYVGSRTVRDASDGVQGSPILSGIMFLIGLATVSVVANGAFKKYRAKQKLAECSAAISEEEERDVWRIISFDYHLHMVGEIPSDIGGRWSNDMRRVIDFLYDDELGRNARYALMQRSPVGRLRYFEKVLRSSKKIRESREIRARNESDGG
jgi:hypothetical protein